MFLSCLSMCHLFWLGTEFVVVEDMSCFDTSAIILKGTTVLTYKPKLLDRPFSGSFFGIEVRRNNSGFIKRLVKHSVSSVMCPVKT